MTAISRSRFSAKNTGSNRSRPSSPTPKRRWTAGSARKAIDMKIGFYTSTFNDRPIAEVCDSAKAAGFDAIELDIGGHIKTPDNVAAAVKTARDRGLFVSSIT